MITHSHLNGAVVLVPCPCGCGRNLPPPLEDFNAGAAMEQWLMDQGLSITQLRSANRAVELVEARRRIAGYLRDHGWSSKRIGRFLSRDHTTVLHLLEGLNAG